MPLPLKKTENAALLNSINNTASKNHIDNIENDITHLTKNRNLNQEEKLKKGYKKIGFFLEPTLYLSLRKKLIEKNQSYEEFFKEILEDILKK